MRRAAVLLTCLAMMLVASCAGIEVREHVLLPTARVVYQNVRKDIDRGVRELVEPAATEITEMADKLGDLLKSGDRAGLLSIDWPKLEAAASLGVQSRIRDGELSEGAARFLYQRIVNFGTVLARLTERLE